MAIKGPKAPPVGRTPPTPDESPSDAITKPASPNASPIESPRAEQRGEGQSEDDAELLGAGRIGDPTVTAKELMQMGSLVRTRHVMTMLARRRKDVEREAVIREAGDLLLELEPAEARRILFQMADAGRIVDVYPLEVLAYVHEQRALSQVTYGPIVINKRGLEAAIFTTAQVIRIKLPLPMRIRAFAMEGGKSVGYCLAPGPPGAYHLQVDEVGEHPMLLRGEVRKKTVLDRLIIRVEDPPES